MLSGSNGPLALCLKTGSRRTAKTGLGLGLDYVSLWESQVRKLSESELEKLQCMSGIPTSLRHTNVYSLKRQFFRLELITTHSKHSTDPLAGRAGFKTHARFRERMVKRCGVAALGNGRQFIVCQ